MKLVFSKSVVEDIDSVIDYIGNNLSNPSAADSFKKTLFERIDMLKESPFLGERLPDRLQIEDSDFRRLVVKNYILVYEVTDSAVIIQRLFYGRREWMAILNNQNL